MSAHLNTVPKNSKCHNTVSPERTAFAHEASRDAFGRHFPAAGAEKYYDRLPETPTPSSASAQFKRGRRRRFPSWQVVQ